MPIYHSHSHTKMTKIHPNSSSSSPSPKLKYEENDESEPVVLTVWKKSLFDCDGFTVFDPHGNLVFRVDNYMSSTKALMDASGNTLLTVRRKKLSLGDTWLICEGETTNNPRFLVRKNMNLLNNRCLAHVTGYKDKYEIEGSYGRRSCGVYDEKRRRVAEIRPKEASVKGVAFGKDVFRLVVHRGFEAAAAMALLILLDQMFGSSDRSIIHL